ncbi:RICIN domain-containing protein [Streptomyces sp. TRM70350]|uniref:RICIN domain-containing protein n=1 Tax=Streptomyces sp. TRM70350 TaxID=2856165 RepID=UPI001C489B34|nr:RICIN domain-containing protein [Streptomyces sp. TRM70350]MBV7700017.1 RICIN domain-containing protein [Streptomyces sp. TRM70350]
MARPEGTDNDAVDGVHSGTSDARLTELLRADTAVAYPALQELRARHRASVLAYARLCTTGDSAARQLAAQAFTRAARETARGTDPAVPWRHQLLLLAGRVAASWAEDDRSAALDAGLLLVLSTAGPDGPVPPMLAAYRTLPARTCGLIWYGVLEQESAERTAVLLGITREDVTYGIEPALGALGRSLLRARLAASDDPGCQDFWRLIEESLRPDSPRHSPDLVAHMAHCPHCTTAYEEQTALRDTPRTALAEGLMPWAGAAYAARITGGPGVGGHAARGRAVGGAGADGGVAWERGGGAGADGRIGWERGGGPGPEGRSARERGGGTGADGRSARERVRPPSRRVALASAGLGVALTPLLFFLLSPGDSPTENASSRISATPPPAVTVTATVPASPASPSPSPSGISESPSPTASPSPSRTTRPPKPSPPPPPATYPPGSAYAQVVNVASGLCLDIRDGVLDKGVDVITAPCSRAATQRWRVDAGRGVLQSAADPDYCLDSRGSTDRGVGIWTCSSVAGRNAQNLKFVVDDAGLIRPAIAVETAVTPDGGDGLVFRSLDDSNGDPDQRWRAGAA